MWLNWSLKSLKKSLVGCKIPTLRINTMRTAYKFGKPQLHESRKFKDDVKAILPSITFIMLGLFISLATNSVRLSSNNLFIRYYWLQPLCVALLTWIGFSTYDIKFQSKIIFTVIVTVIYYLFTAPQKDDHEDVKREGQDSWKRTTKII